MADRKKAYSYTEQTVLGLITGFVIAAVSYYITGNEYFAAIIGCADFFIVFTASDIRKRIKSKSGQTGEDSFVLWFTGLSGSGKTTLAHAIHERFLKNDVHVELLDGDEVRALFPNTGFTREERNSHIMRVGHIASLLEKNGIIVLTSLISPYRESRDRVRQMCKNFIEVYVATSLDECRKRDVKGLYDKAGRGEIKNFTGLDDPYEEPLQPEITVSTEGKTVSETADYIISQINSMTGMKL